MKPPNFQNVADISITHCYICKHHLLIGPFIQPTSYCKEYDHIIFRYPPPILFGNPLFIPKTICDNFSLQHIEILKGD